MTFIDFFPPPEPRPTVRIPQYSQQTVAFADTMENLPNDPIRSREPASPRRTWKGRFQRVLARVAKFFRRGRRTVRR